MIESNSSAPSLVQLQQVEVEIEARHAQRYYDSIIQQSILDKEPSFYFVLQQLPRSVPEPVLPKDSSSSSSSSSVLRPLRIGILDSSFNPPTLAHTALLVYSNAQLAGTETSPDTICASKPGSTNVCSGSRITTTTTCTSTSTLNCDRRMGFDGCLLLLSTVNADKQSGDAALSHRLAMTELVARIDVPSLLPEVPCSVGVVNCPLFVDKAEVVRRAYEQQLKQPVELFFIVGIDTFVRIINPKYYVDLSAAMERLFSAAHLVILPREGFDMDQVLSSADCVSAYRSHLHVVDAAAIQPYLTISSTKARQELSRNLSESEQVQTTILPCGDAPAVTSTAASPNAVVASVSPQPQPHHLHGLTQVSLSTARYAYRHKLYIAGGTTQQAQSTAAAAAAPPPAAATPASTTGVVSPIDAPLAATAAVPVSLLQSSWSSSLTKSVTSEAASD